MYEPVGPGSKREKTNGMTPNQLGPGNSESGVGGNTASPTPDILVPKICKDLNSITRKQTIQSKKG